MDLEIHNARGRKERNYITARVTYQPSPHNRPYRFPIEIWQKQILRM